MIFVNIAAGFVIVTLMLMWLYIIYAVVRYRRYRQSLPPKPYRNSKSKSSFTKAVEEMQREIEHSFAISFDNALMRNWNVIEEIIEKAVGRYLEEE